MMNNRVYGVIGISSIMANWNADFSGFPKTISSGEVFGSDKALKYPMKKMWNDNGEKVLYIKSMKFSEKDNSLVPNTLGERYEKIFSVEDLKKVKDTREILKNLFSAIDVKNFGATFAESGNNISITGAVQFGQGFNKYDASVAEEQQILSPFRDGKSDGKKEKDKEAKNSTLGTKIVSNEAHYMYPFAINPLAYKEYVELGVTEGYTNEDYKLFKETALVSATAYATNAKEGCENEFALFIEGESKLYLPNLSEYIKFSKGEEKNNISINCGELINDLKDKINNIEIYYNPLTTVISSNIEGVKMYNIITQKEIEV